MRELGGTAVDIRVADWSDCVLSVLWSNPSRYGRSGCRARRGSGEPPMTTRV